MTRALLSCLAAVALLAGCDLVGRLGAQAASDTCTTPGADPAKVIEACTAVITAADTERHDRAMAYVYRSGAHEAQGDVRVALADLTRGIAVDPAFASPLSERGSYYLRHDALDLAQRDLERALEIDPAQQRTMLELGFVHERAGRFDQALAQYTRAHDALPRDPEALNAMCWARALQDVELDRALADCDRALALDENPNTRDSRGFVHFRAGRFAEAVADYSKVLEDEPDFASSRYVRGLALRALGRTAEGDADVKKALELEPGIDARYAGYGVVADAATPATAAP